LTDGRRGGREWPGDTARTRTECDGQRKGTQHGREPNTVRRKHHARRSLARFHVLAPCAMRETSRAMQLYVGRSEEGT
jgi:hypothetical protein